MPTVTGTLSKLSKHQTGLRDQAVFWNWVDWQESKTPCEFLDKSIPVGSYQGTISLRCIRYDIDVTRIIQPQGTATMKMR